MKQILLIIGILSILILSGCDRLKCEKYNGNWVTSYNCGPGGCQGGYCNCPQDISKYHIRDIEKIRELNNQEGDLVLQLPKGDLDRCWKDDGLLVCFTNEGPHGCLK